MRENCCVMRLKAIASSCEVQEFAMALSAARERAQKPPAAARFCP
jgi:hypothetical protein